MERRHTEPTGTQREPTRSIPMTRARAAVCSVQGTGDTSMADKKGGVATDTIMSPAEMKPLLMLSKHQPVSAVVGMTKDKDGVILLSRRLKPKKLLVQLKADARKAKVDLDITSLRFGKAEVDTDKDSGLVMFTVNKDAPGALRMKLLELIKRVPLAKVEIDVDAKIEAEPEDDDEQPDASHDSSHDDAAPQATPVNNAEPQSANLDMPPLAATDHDVFFSRDSAVLTSDDEKSLAAYADRYIKNADPIQITVVGYASMDGDPTENQRLSQHRAEAVKKFLSDKQGIKGDLIKTDWHGATDQFRDHPPASNRRAVFGPPIAAPTKGDDSGSGKSDGGKSDGGKSPPVKETTKTTAVQPLVVTQKQFTDIFGADLLAQWNAFKTKGGPVPPSRQLSLNLTLKGSLIHHENGNLTIDWFDEPTIAVQFNSSGPAASDQEAANLVKLHWENTILRHPIELSIQGVAQNLFTSGASPAGGAQPQLKVLVTKQIAVVVGGAFMLGNGPDDKFNYNLSGFMGVDVTAF
jgi:outer membrane protein OmpA-like peptidoglycan-associated protein